MGRGAAADREIVESSRPRDWQPVVWEFVVERAAGKLLRSEGFRLAHHRYRFDFNANRLNLAKGFNKLGDVRRQAAREGWMEGTTSHKPPQQTRA